MHVGLAARRGCATTKSPAHRDYLHSVRQRMRAVDGIGSLQPFEAMPLLGWLRGSCSSVGAAHAKFQPNVITRTAVVSACGKGQHGIEGPADTRGMVGKADGLAALP